MFVITAHFFFHKYVSINEKRHQRATHLQNKNKHLTLNRTRIQQGARKLSLARTQNTNFTRYENHTGQFGRSWSQRITKNKAQNDNRALIAIQIGLTAGVSALIESGLQEIRQLRFKTALEDIHGWLPRAEALAALALEREGARTALWLRWGRRGALGRGLTCAFLCPCDRWRPAPCVNGNAFWLCFGWIYFQKQWARVLDPGAICDSRVYNFINQSHLHGRRR